MSTQRSAVTAALVFCFLALDVEGKEGPTGGWAKALNASRHTKTCFGTTGGTVVDVGARGGGETRMAMRLGFSVVAVECSRKAFVSLRDTFQRKPDVSLHFGCASDKPGVAQLYDAVDSSSLHKHAVSAGPEVRKLRSGRNKTVAVPLIVLDTLLASRSKICGAKIDTQGHELHVMMGMEKMISKHRPVLYFEYIPRLIGADGPKLMAWVKARGYKCDFPNGCGPVPASAMPASSPRAHGIFNSFFSRGSSTGVAKVGARSVAPKMADAICNNIMCVP